LAACLTKRLAEERKGNIAGRTVSDPCAKHLAEFKVDRSDNINKDVPLGAPEEGRGCHAGQRAALASAAWRSSITAPKASCTCHAGTHAACMVAAGAAAAL
jgi:hypothetical protein